MNNMNQNTQNNILTIIEETDMNFSSQKIEFGNPLNSKNNGLNNTNNILNDINMSEKNYDNHSKSNYQCVHSNSK